MALVESSPGASSRVTRVFGLWCLYALRKVAHRRHEQRAPGQTGAGHDLGDVLVAQAQGIQLEGGGAACLIRLDHGAPAPGVAADAGGLARLWRARGATADAFHAAKGVAVYGLTTGVLLYGVGFLTVVASGSPCGNRSPEWSEQCAHFFHAGGRGVAAPERPGGVDGTLASAFGVQPWMDTTDCSCKGLNHSKRMNCCKKHERG